MNLRTRLIFMTGTWILLIILFFNVFIYYYILRKTTEAENRMLWNKAQVMLRTPEMHDPNKWADKKLLEEFTEENMLIRIIAPDGHVPAEVSSNEQLSAFPARYRNGYYSTVENNVGSKKLFIQVPIRVNGVQMGVLELGKELDVLSSVLEILATGLMITTLSVSLFSVAGGVIYTRVIIRPLRELLETMKAIRSKGDFVLLSPKFTSQKDELGRLGQTFNEMIIHLRENDRKQKQFVADASHELRTPLTVIESYTSLLKRWGGSDPEIRREALDAIQSESIRLKNLINSLLKLAEAEREDLFNPVQLELVPVVQQAAEQLEHAFQREIRMTVSSAAEHVKLSADAGKLKQLLIIVIDNAIKYSSKPINVNVLREPKYAVVQIVDQGIGVRKEELSHLFERFYRVDQARSRGTGGSGLGLAIAKHIVDLHEGTIRIQSVEGEGTAVTIRLPLATLY